MRKGFAIFFWLSGLIVLTGLSLIFWFLRDGLKAGMVESHGPLAWQRFAESLPTLLACAAPFFVVGCLLFPWRQTRQRQAMEKADAEDAWPPPPKIPRDEHT